MRNTAQTESDGRTRRYDVCTVLLWTGLGMLLAGWAPLAVVVAAAELHLIDRTINPAGLGVLGVLLTLPSAGLLFSSAVIAGIRDNRPNVPEGVWIATGAAELIVVLLLMYAVVHVLGFI